MATVVTLMH